MERLLCVRLEDFVYFSCQLVVNALEVSIPQERLLLNREPTISEGVGGVSVR